MCVPVRTLPTTRTRYAQRLEEENIIAPDMAEQMQRNYRDLLDTGSSVTPKVLLGEPVAPGVAVNWKSYVGHGWHMPCDTTVSMETLAMLSAGLRALNCTRVWRK